MLKLTYIVDKNYNTVYTVYIRYERLGGLVLEIIISNGKNQPIYEQIYDQIKEQILKGYLKEDQALPSIRSLAKDLKISVITTKRAYDDLERDGYIYTVPSKGSYVKGANLDLIKEEYLRLMEESLRQAKIQGKFAGLNRDQAIEAFKYIWEEEND